MRNPRFRALLPTRFRALLPTRFRALLPVLLPALLATAPSAYAVSCTVAASLPGDQRAALFDAAHRLGGDVLRNDPAALKAATIPSVASDFSGIAGTVSAVAPGLQGATLTVTNLYALNALDLPSTAPTAASNAPSANDDVQFFCSVPGAQLLVTVTLDSLPRGQYALALLHATGAKTPQQFALILQNTATSATAPPVWQLAGFFARPLTMDGHDSTWFWSQARTLKAKGDPFSAFLYDQAAAFLARPADLFTSNNLDKLSRETAAVEPQGLPGNQPMLVTTPDTTFAVTGLRADAGLGSLDLRVDTRVPSIADPVTARASALTLMRTLLHDHPSLRDSFHGIWIFEATPTGQTFAVEQPMSALS